ncbi:DUF3575 domain-containing protein [uncultured Rikenella sp.]|uniref:DUF3575 domain-containing protein n=1 Tax=uncultured Rikenella sp. TaxID=368003 RepID=UPI0026076FBB|nr:DUF3575 domain-containing protein [uncultured Rikenella sp.]
MDFAKCRKSIITADKRRWTAWGAAVCLCLSGTGGRADAQVAGLSTPQKQVMSFTFGLGSSEWNERYGQNRASMDKFDKLIQQLAETPSAHIDSIVVTSYSSTAEQLGSVDLAERRIDAVKAYIEPVVRRSQLRQQVVVKGNVVARNNVIAAEQLFDMLKKTTVTVYMNGVLVAGHTRTRSAGSAAEEERRYISPFGDRDVFGRGGERVPSTVAVEKTTTTTITAVEPKPEPVQQIPTPTQIQIQEPTPTQIQIPAPKPETTASVPVRQDEKPVVAVAKAEEKQALDEELQRYIDSLVKHSEAEKLPEIMPAEQPKQQEQPEITPPAAPVITAEDPCPEGRDPEIDDLIRRLIAEESTLQIALPETEPVTEIQRTEEVETEIAGEAEAVQAVADTRKEKIRPVKEPKVKPVKAVKAPREPMVLIRPLVAVKTNLAYWAAVAANLEVEFYFAQKWSAAVEGVYTDWNMNLYKKHYAVNEISPEVRYWFGRRTGQYRGLYLGVYGHVGQFDYMFKNEETGNTGDYYGGGISLGGYLPFTRHFGMELGLRGGFVHAGNFDRYYYEAPFYMYKSSHSANYIGLTGAKVSLVYRFGLGK